MIERKTALATGLLATGLLMVPALVLAFGPGEGYWLSVSSRSLVIPVHTPALLDRKVSPHEDGGIASLPCGDGSITQSASFNILPNHTVQCVSKGSGVPSDNGLARSFSISDDTSICGVSFGIESTDGVGAWPITVNLYEGDVSGPFAALELRGSASVSIPPNTAQAHFTALFDDPVSFAAGEKMVVELFIKSRVAADGGDGGKMFLGSNNLGQSAPSYVRAPTCNLPNFVTYASIGHPLVHVVLEVFTHLPAGACCIEDAGAQCPADLTGSGNVGVADLLELLSQWGACPPPPAPCPADLTGNGSVGVADLLELLSQWGPCPESGGGAGLVCEQLTASECVAAGGDFHGPGTDCPSPSTCPIDGACCFGYGECLDMAPDDCDLAGGVFKGSSTSCFDAVCDLGPPCPPGGIEEGEQCGEDMNGGCNAVPPAYMQISCGDAICGSAWAHDNERDTDWYTVTLVEETELVWSVEAPFLAQVAILNDLCGEELEVLADGESEPGSSITVASACLQPGTYRLFVAIDVYDGHPCGSGMNSYVATLSCSGCEPPDNTGDSCLEAIPISINGTASGSNVGNDWEVDLYCDEWIEPESGVLWFKVTGNGAQLTAFNANLPGTLWFTDMYVYCGTCSAPACHGQPVSHPNWGEAYTWCSEPGQTYYLAVWGVAGNEGEIAMSVTSGQACEPDACEAAGLCEDLCGGQSEAGCWCDDGCHFFNDCCPGICNDCPDVAGCAHECFGLCGMQAPSGCWCDTECEPFNDCCEEVCDICPLLPGCQVGSCAGVCGGGYPEGCYETSSCECFCDEDCWLFGDCCNDVCDECPDLGFCP